MAETKRRAASGQPSTNLVFSAYMQNNEDIFPLILQLYVRDGAEVADVTYGRGVFWKKVDKSARRD